MTARILKEGGVGAGPGDSTSKGCLHNQKKATAVHQKFMVMVKDAVSAALG